MFRELLPADRAINSKKYRAQLEKLSEAVATKRPGLANRGDVISRHDTARPRVARNVRKKNYVNLVGEILSDPPCSPDIAPLRLSPVSIVALLFSWQKKI